MLEMESRPRLEDEPGRAAKHGRAGAATISVDGRMRRYGEGGTGMKIGAIVPQGWVGEYDGWEPLDAWRRTTEVAQQADRLGFDAIWLFDHFHTVPRPTDEITFESFTSLSALAALTTRVRLGHIVICTAFRNPALTAKMISTMDRSAAAGWSSASAPAGRRTSGSRTATASPRRRSGWRGSATTSGSSRRCSPATSTSTRPTRASTRSVHDARNIPKPIQQPRVPIMVGGNGPNVTWRLAAKHADELNLDGMSPADVAEALPVVRSRCEEIGRDPATLPISVHIWTEDLEAAGASRVDRLAGYAELGVSRVMGLLRASPRSDEALESLVEDARAAGLELA